MVEVDMMEYLKIADIGEDGKEKVRDLEKSLGAHVMAFEFGLKLAKLTEAQRQEVAAVEEALGGGVMLLAYDE
jgi:hypothetical protein